MASADFARFMPDVAAELLGPPNKRLSSKSELRFGTNGSLSIDLDKATFYDHERKAGGGVLDLIAWQTGRHNNGSAGGAVEWLRDHGYGVDEPAAAASPAPARAHIAATYDYVDERGDLLFQVVRYAPKTFRQRRKPTAEDPPERISDGWVWSVKGVRQVPYRLPALLEAMAMERTVFIAEGEKDADALWGIGVPATTNAMGAGKWPRELSPYFDRADVVHLPDNDEAGRKHTALVGACLAGIASRQRVLTLPGLPDKGDVSDWIAAGGTADQLFRLVETAAVGSGQQAAPALRFNAVWFADIDRGLDDPEWLVDDLLTCGDKSLVFGPSQSGKSFLASHIAMAIARGFDIFGRKVRRGGVVYIAAEGKKGFKKRLRAYRQEFAIEANATLPFLLLPVAIDLYGDGDMVALLEDLTRVVAMLAAMGVGLELVVVDTLAAVSPGANENASEDMSRIIRHCDDIQGATSAHVMIVHHKNAAGDRPRGHTSLYAACDNAIEVTCDEQGNRTAKIAKLKDGEDGARIGFRLQSVTIGSRDDGKPITSCVVVPAEDQARTGKNRFLSDQQRIALTALREALIDHGESAPAALKLPYGVRVVHIEHWKREFLQRGFIEEPNASTFRGALKRVGEGLKARGIIGTDSPYVWIAREPSQGAVA